MIQGMFDRGAMPVLERVIQFTAARHKVLAHDIANMSTPYFKPVDLDPKSFQATLRKAVDQRQRSDNPTGSTLKMRDTRQFRFRPDGIEVRPGATNDGILFHDQNNRDLERIMQHLSENRLMYETSYRLLQDQYSLLETAIRGRV